MIVDSIEIEAPFFDVDSCDVVWHGHYVKYFEQARCGLLNKIGYNYQDMREDGYFFPIVDLNIKFIQPLVFRQTFIVQTTLLEWQHRLKIEYLVCDKKSGEKITQGHTTQVAVQMPDQQMQFECPQQLIDKVALLL